MNPSRSMSLTLHGESFWISPYVFSCYVALREKGLPFAMETVALHKAEQHQNPFRDLSLTAQVPVLVHDGFWLGESLAIMEYLEETFPAPTYPRLLPADPQQRARARHLQAWLRSDLLPLREERPTTTIFYRRPTTPLSPAGRVAMEKLLRVAGLLIHDGATTLFGAWSLADADLALALQRLLANGHDVPAKLRHFAEVQWARPSVQEFVTHARPPFVPH
ncbi:MAG: glutathione transferase [Myxococcales bacterium]|nr:glutathione transferase [Myxococcota bacterium]MDW8283671.1 glutathione transferase [Myxococcales bacterium]